MSETESDGNASNAKDSDLERRARLFQHGMHEEGVFYNRLNFFLVFESLLFAVAVGGFGKDDAPPLAIITLVCIVGLIVSLIWGYAQINKLVLLKTLEDRLEQELTEFKETIGVADRQRIFRVWSANSVLAYTMPTLFAGAWLYLLHYLCCHT